MLLACRPEDGAHRPVMQQPRQPRAPGTEPADSPAQGRAGRSGREGDGGRGGGRGGGRRAGEGRDDGESSRCELLVAFVHCSVVGVAGAGRETTTALVTA